MEIRSVELADTLYAVTTTVCVRFITWVQLFNYIIVFNISASLVFKCHCGLFVGARIMFSTTVAILFSTYIKVYAHVS